MCYIMLVKRLGNPNLQIEDKLRDILKQRMTHNSHGFFVKNHGGELRTLNKNEAEDTIENMDMQSVMTHFRMASIGKISQSNVHGWNVNDWQLVHNGTISSYSGGEDTDSLLFFNDLMLLLSNVNPKKTKKISHAIQRLCTEVNFAGRVALYNNKVDKMYLFGDWQIYLYDNQYLVVSSAGIYSWGETENKVGGFKFTGTTNSISKTTIDGVGVIHNFGKPSWSYESLTKELKLKDWKKKETKNDIKTDIEILNKVFPNAEVVSIRNDAISITLPIESSIGIKLTKEQYDDISVLEMAETIQQYYQNFAEDRDNLTKGYVDAFDLEGVELVSYSGAYHYLDSSCCLSDPSTCISKESLNYFPVIKAPQDKSNILQLPGKTYTVKELIEQKAIAKIHV